MCSLPIPKENMSVGMDGPHAVDTSETVTWDVDHDYIEHLGVDVDAFIVRLWVRPGCPFFLRASGVHLAGAWSPGRDPSTMKGKVQLAVAPALLYTHQVCRARSHVRHCQFGEEPSADDRSWCASTGRGSPGPIFVGALAAQKEESGSIHFPSKSRGTQFDIATLALLGGWCTGVQGSVPRSSTGGVQKAVHATQQEPCAAQSPGLVFSDVRDQTSR